MAGLSFTGKVVLVTGADSTVGSELAKYFSKLGASLVLTGCDKYRLNKVGEECLGSPLLTIAADLTKDEDVTRAIEETIVQFKKIDVLINYVGSINNCKADDQTTSGAFKLMMDVTVCSVFCITQLVYPHLAKTRGNVVNVHGLLSSSPKHLSCSVSRAALDELTKSMASQYINKGVRVNTVSAVSVESQPQSSGSHSEMKSEIRTRPCGADVAAAVVFLASDLATFIVGANLPVDGGKRLATLKEILDNPVEKNQAPNNGAKNPVPKAEKSQADTHSKERSLVDGSSLDNSKRQIQKNEPGKQSTAKQEARKSEVDKSTNAKLQDSEKTSTVTTKNNH